MRMLFILLASVRVACAQGWTGWHPTAWDTPRLASPEVVRVQAVTNGPFVFTNYLPQWNQVVDGASTNYVYGWPPDGSCSTNKVISTNAFLSDIVANAGALDTGAVVNTWSFDLNDCTGGAYTVTRTVTNYPAFTNLYLQAKEIVALDCYYAIYERWSALRAIGKITSGGPEKPRFYRNMRDALISLKSAALGMATAFNPAEESPTMRGAEIWFYGWDYRTALQTFGVPTNYLTFTPYRALASTNAGYGSTITNTYVMAQTYTKTCLKCYDGFEDICDPDWWDFTCEVWSDVQTNSISTNITVDGCGNVVTNIGRAGDVVARVCTNYDYTAARILGPFNAGGVEPGRWSHEYGWWSLRTVLTNLTTTAHNSLGRFGTYNLGYAQQCVLRNASPFEQDLELARRAHDTAINMTLSLLSGDYYRAPGVDSASSVGSVFWDGYAYSELAYFSASKPSIIINTSSIPLLASSSVQLFENTPNESKPYWPYIGWPWGENGGGTNITTNTVSTTILADKVLLKHESQYPTVDQFDCSGGLQSFGFGSNSTNSYLLFEKERALPAPAAYPVPTGEDAPPDDYQYRSGQALYFAASAKIRWNFERK